MSLVIESIPANVSQALQQIAPDEPTPDQVRELAQELIATLAKEPGVIAQAEVIVRRLANLRREQETRQAAITANRSYTFARPHRSSTSMHPTFEQFRVRVTDFGAFCHSMGVSEREMLKVANGEIESYRGWRLGAMAGAARAARLDKASPVLLWLPVPSGQLSAYQPKA